MRTFHGSGFSKILLRSPAVIRAHKDPGHFLQECGHEMRCRSCQLRGHSINTCSSPPKTGATANLFQLGDQIQGMVGIVWVGHDWPGGKANSVLGALPYYPLRIRVQAEQPQHGCFGGNNGFRNQTDHRLRVCWSAEAHCDEGVCAFHNGVVGEILLIPWLRKPHIYLDSKQAA